MQYFQYRQMMYTWGIPFMSTHNFQLHPVIVHPLMFTNCT